MKLILTKDVASTAPVKSLLSGLKCLWKVWFKNWPLQKFQSLGFFILMTNSIEKYIIDNLRMQMFHIIFVSWFWHYNYWFYWIKHSILKNLGSSHILITGWTIELVCNVVLSKLNILTASKVLFYNEDCLQENLQET